MKKQPKNSTHGWALHVAVSIALLSISAVLLASGFKAVPTTTGLSAPIQPVAAGDKDLPDGVPSPTPICPPAWTAMAPIPSGVNAPQLRYGFAQTATDFYLVGGLNSSFANTGALVRYNIATDVWTPLATAPATINQAPSAAYWNGKIYAIGGLDGTPTTTVQIYDIATDAWSAGAPIPAGTYGAAAGAFNNKVFVAGGTDPGAANPTTTLFIYDIATNTWSAGTSMPAPGYLLGGFTQAGQYLYLAGGFTSNPANNLTETLRLDMTSAPGVWTTGPVFTPARGDFGLAASGTKLYAIGGDANGGGFFDFTNAVDELDVSAWPAGAWVSSPPVLPSARQANQAGFATATGLWSTGGYNGTALAEHLVRGNGVGCATPSPSPTPTATFTPTPTATATFTPTATATATATVTATPTPTPTATSTVCPLGQGYWKNHSNAWPVNTLTLGSQTYTKAELLNILNNPGGGDASMILAVQLIAAKLNIANGSDPTPIASTITHADSLLSMFSGKLPYKVKPSSSIGQMMVNDGSTLDDYNSGKLTPGCSG